jgi:hypothetical protein
MEQEARFIAFDLEGMNHIDQLVANLLDHTISFMNKEVHLGMSQHNYPIMNGADVEKLSYDSMRKVAPQIGFDTSRIDLVSGHTFPDIILHETRYGVEVKSTKKDSWISTGSSIVESTRNINTDHIYMLFGKLGGTPEFRCKPYQQCLSNIAVTHSPRYLIDMDLTQEENIFYKMKTNYEDFRQFEESQKISIVREYYLQKAKAERKYEMPWWMGGTTNVNLAFYNDLSLSEKNMIQARACILFKSLYQNDSRNRYRPISLWLCNSYSLLCPNMRDDFSAGGKCTVINGKKLEKAYPHIVKELLLSHKQIKTLLTDPDEDILRDIQDFWDFDYNKNNLYDSWLKMVVGCFKKNPQLNFIPIKKLLETDAIPC